MRHKALQCGLWNWLGCIMKLLTQLPKSGKIPQHGIGTCQAGYLVQNFPLFVVYRLISLYYCLAGGLFPGLIAACYVWTNNACDSRQHNNDAQTEPCAWPIPFNRIFAFKTL